MFWNVGVTGSLTGMDYWNGLPENWNGLLEWDKENWNGLLLEWNTGMDTWKGCLEWNTGMEYRNGILLPENRMLELTTGMDYWRE
jgi:hypothetical protein